MRVLWVLHTPRDPTTGVFAAVTADAEALRARGHLVEILTPGDLLTGWRRSPRWLPLVWPWVALRWILRNPPFDVLIFHSFTGWGPALARRWFPRVAKALFVTQFHGLEPLYTAPGPGSAQAGVQRPSRLHLLYRGPVMNALLAAGCRGSDLVFCLNTVERSYLVGRRWGTAETVRVVHPPVPAPFFTDHDYSRTVERLIFVGQWQPGKGARDLGAALQRLRGMNPAVSLVCAGTRADKEQVLSDFPEACRNAVEVIPQFERLTLPLLLAQCEVFVHPSHSEGSSVALREAMAAGMPIVATPVGACPDLLRDRESVLMVPPGDPESLAERVAQFIRDEALRRRCGEGARAVAEGLQLEERLAEIVAREFLQLRREDRARRGDRDRAGRAR